MAPFVRPAFVQRFEVKRKVVFLLMMIFDKRPDDCSEEMLHASLGVLTALIGATSVALALTFEMLCLTMSFLRAQASMPVSKKRFCYSGGNRSRARERHLFYESRENSPFPRLCRSCLNCSWS